MVELLSDNYTGVAQTVNLLAEWMIQAGVDIKEVQETVESHLKEMIIRTFDPKKADSIFSGEGEVCGICRPSFFCCLSFIVQFTVFTFLIENLLKSSVISEES